MEEVKIEVVERTTKFSMPTFEKMNIELWMAVLGLVIGLLPAILIKLLAFSQNPMLTPDSLVAQPSFNAATVLVAFIFSTYALAKDKGHHATRTIALLALIVSIIRLLLQ